MGQSCTLFAVAASELKPADERKSPRTDETTMKVVRPGALHTLELGRAWTALHVALGGHPGDHPLGFLAAGGEAVPPLDDKEHSGGRYFTPAEVVKLRAAFAAVKDPTLDDSVLGPLQKVRILLGEAAQTDRGVIVHLFG
ncbi:MAG: hypothetical protein JWP01_1057 [Myxococcales bacterium]|nr:hypothetical protein [Myxococcales bacterium]